MGADLALSHGRAILPQFRLSGCQGLHSCLGWSLFLWFQCCVCPNSPPSLGLKKKEQPVSSPRSCHPSLAVEYCSDEHLWYLALLELRAKPWLNFGMGHSVKNRGRFP